MENPYSDFNRRRFVQLAAASTLAVGARSSGAAATSPSETEAVVTPQPSPSITPDENTADIIVETLIAWGATHAFGIVGDGINSIIEAFRKRQDRIRYIGVRHEEAAAFMAAWPNTPAGSASASERRDRNWMNGLYDAALDGAPVIALTGLTFHDLIGVRYQQGVDTVRLMQGVALYNEQITGPEHAVIVTNRACRAALGDRAVAHLTISKDVQMTKISADKRSMRNPGARTSSSWLPAAPVPPADELQGRRRYSQLRSARSPFWPDKARSGRARN